MVLDQRSKFMYLLQTITPKSKASETVNSYPIYGRKLSESNSTFKREKFGSEDTLIQIDICGPFATTGVIQ